jgi:hypothetical protein
MAVLIFALLGSVSPDETRTRSDEMKNGLCESMWRVCALSCVFGPVAACLSRPS